MRAGATLIGLILFASLGGIAAADPDGLLFVSRGDGANGPVPGKNTNNDQPSIEAKGQRIAFRSDANNLSGADNDSTSNIFLRDAKEKKTFFISRASGKNGDGGGNVSRNPAIAGNGRYVAFESLADNLTPNDSESTYDIFVRDTLENKTLVASLRTGAPAGPLAAVTSQEDSFEPSINGSGRLVAFSSRAALAPGDTNDFEDVYVRNVETNITTLVSRASGEDGAVGDGLSSDAAISENGRYVAFTSLGSTNLGSGLPATAPNNSQVYLRDLFTDTTVLVSRASGANGAVGDDQSERASVSNNGRVAFASRSENFSAVGDDAISNVFVRDLGAATTTLVSVPVTGGGPGVRSVSSNPVITRDGKWVVFDSDAENLSKDDESIVSDVYSRDLANKKTIFVSRAAGANGAAGFGTSGEPSVSSTGKFVAFTSNADNLSKKDHNGAFSNVFRRQVR